MNLVISLVMVVSLQVTSYRSVKTQTDLTPFNTSTGERVSFDGVAISQDMLCGACRRLHKQCQHPEYSKKLHYNQWVFIDKIGFKRINDVMNKRYKNRMDVWVPNFKEEKYFHKKYGHTKLTVYKVEIKETSK